MIDTYQKTARVGFIRACLRYIEDPNRSLISRIFLALTPLLIFWIILPLDLIPEIVLGPIGLADDGAIIIALFLLFRLAISFYSEKRYIKPIRKHLPDTTK